MFCTPPKINMKPENVPGRKRKNIYKSPIFGFHISFRVFCEFLCVFFTSSDSNRQILIASLSEGSETSSGTGSTSSVGRPKGDRWRVKLFKGKVDTKWWKDTKKYKKYDVSLIRNRKFINRYILDVVVVMWQKDVCSDKCQLQCAFARGKIAS